MTLQSVTIVMRGRPGGGGIHSDMRGTDRGGGRFSNVQHRHDRYEEPARGAGDDHAPDARLVGRGGQRERGDDRERGGEGQAVTRHSRRMRPREPIR